MIKIQKKSLKVGKYVDNHHVDKVIRTYKQKRWVPNSERLGKEDSLSAWYSIEELEEFIETAKSQGGDGVRIYFAAYPENYSEVPGYAGRQTVVLVGTKSKDTEAGMANKDIYYQKEGKPTILAYNGAFICPPICNPRFGDADSGFGMVEIGTTIVENSDNNLSMV